MYHFFSIFVFCLFRIDATKNNGRLGRLVNDAKTGLPECNCFVKKVMINGQRRLGIFANRDIESHEELRYDYGIQDSYWRKVSANQIF